MPILRWKQAKAVLGIVVFGVFILVLPARADVWTTTSQIISAIAQVIISLVSQILVALIQILLAVTQYNDFINAPAVIKGWVLVRDVSNLAFLVIFIGIAFATILGVEKYEYKRLLPKLLIMAVLINFSRTICGLILDAAQVVMMTFVNGFKDVAAGNLIRGFGLGDMLTLRDEKPGDPGVTPNTIAAASLLAVVMLIIATITVGVIVVMFLVRILYLWILVLLSPLAFMLSAAPGLSGKFDEWWGKFIKYAFVGPIMAFFLWLSFSIMASVQPGSTLASESRIMPTDTYDDRVGATITKIGESDQLLSYGIAIALLLLSLSIASEMGVKGGSLATAALGKIRSGGGTLAKLAGGAVLTGGVGTIGMYGAYKGGRAFAKTTAGKWTGRRMDDWISPKVTKWLGEKGVQVSKGEGWLGKAAGKLGAKDLLGEKSRFGIATARLAEKGAKLRTIKAGWKERAEDKEKSRTAQYVGVSRDLFNGIIDGAKTNYSFRNLMALVEEKAKKQRDETDATTETFLDILENSKNEVDRLAALLNLNEQNDFNEVNLSSKFAGDIHKQVIAEMGGNITKEEGAIQELRQIIPQAVRDGFSKLKEADNELSQQGESLSNQLSLEILAKKAEEWKSAGRNDEEISNLQKEYEVEIQTKLKDIDQQRQELAKQRSDLVTSANQQKVEFKPGEFKGAGDLVKELDDKETNLGRFKHLQAKFQTYDKMDTDMHREVGARMLFGDNATAAQFLSKLGSRALAKGGYNSFALASYDTDSRDYKFANTTTPEGYMRHVAYVAGKGRNMSIPTILSGHPGTFRFEVIDKTGKRTYDDEFSDVGKRLFMLTLHNLVERNLGQMRADSFGAIMGGINIRNYPGLYSDNEADKRLAAQEFYEALIKGYEDIIIPMMGEAGTVTDTRSNAVLAAVERYKPKTRGGT